MIYLDHAATSMYKPPEVYTAVLDTMKSCASLGRSGHEAARRAAEVAYNCRVEAGEFFDANPDQVVFTSNATHGLNIAIHSLVSRGDRVVVSGFEHNAVMRPLHHVGANVVIAGCKLFDFNDTLNAFRKAITSETKLVVCTHVSNVFGYILPVEEIAKLCQKRGISFVLDASQSAGVLPVSLKRLGAAFIAMPGHKSLLGPQGTGLLLCGQLPKPLMTGGTGSSSLDMKMPGFLPDISEVGTHNVPGIAGLLAGIRWLQDYGIDAVRKRECRLISAISDKLSHIHDVRQYYGASDLQTGVLSFQSKRMDCEAVANALAAADIAVRAGLHCAPLAHQSAGTLDRGTVRISVSPKNTMEEANIFAEILAQILSRNNCG